MGVESAHFHGIVNGETNFVAYYAYFTAELHQFTEQFENLVFVIMSTRENIHLIARTPLVLVSCV